MNASHLRLIRLKLDELSEDIAIVPPNSINVKIDESIGKNNLPCSDGK